MPREAIGELIRFIHYLTGDDSIVVDEAVARGEQDTGFRNIALANYMRAFGNIHHPVERVLGSYFHRVRHRHELRPARHGGTLSHARRAASGGRAAVISESRARTHQCPHAHLWPL